MRVHVRMGEFEISTTFLLLLVLCAVGFWYFSIYERPITNEESTNESIVAFGDSLVVGVGAKQNGGFVGALERDLGIDIINLGVSGDTTLRAWDRIDAVLKEKPRLVLISLGGNDFIRRADRGEVESRYGRMIAQIHEAGGAVIILGVPGYYGLYRDLARTYDTGYVSNILKGLLANEQYMFDAIHPNDEGYEKIAKRIKPELMRILK